MVSTPKILSVAITRNHFTIANGTIVTQGLPSGQGQGSVVMVANGKLCAVVTLEAANKAGPEDVVLAPPPGKFSCAQN